MSGGLGTERRVLDAALSNAGAWATVTRQLSPSDFLDPDHRTVFLAICGVEPVGGSVDFFAVKDRLVSGGHGALMDYVRESILSSALTLAPLGQWITDLLDGSRRRKTIVALHTALGAVHAQEPHEEIEIALERSLAAIRASAPDGRVFDDKGAMVAAALAYLESDSRSGTPYGFAPWDNAVLPAQPGHLVLFGGASGSGKSTVVRNVLRSYVQRYQARVGWLTCEMTGEEQLVHLACIDSQVDIEDYYRRRLTPDQSKRFAAEIGAWRDTDLLHVNELGQVTPDVALRIFRRWREQGVTHFVLDHLHRLDYGASKSGDDLRVPVAAFARALKTFAKDTQSLVVALVQYSKIKPHEEPSDDKIREANNILEESDAVFHIYRPLVACERDVHGLMHPLTKPDGLPYFEHEAPKGSPLAHDTGAVYVKLGKQRRRLRDGLIRIPFNHRLAVMFDTARPDLRRMA